MPTLILITLTGWLAGAGINYLADVLPIRRRLVAPFCLACQAPMPPVNYWLWPRRCPACGARRRIRTWLVEIIIVGAALYVWLSPSPVMNFGRLSFPVSLLLLIYLGVVAVIDIEYRLIMHPVSLAGAVLGLGIGIWLHGPTSTLLGGLAGFGIMLALYGFGMLLMRISSRWRGRPAAVGGQSEPEVGDAAPAEDGAEDDEEALGFGDVNLGGVVGLLLGWPGVAGGLVLAILLGGAASLLYLIGMLLSRRYQPNLALPYGPFLVASVILLLFFRSLFF